MARSIRYIGFALGGLLTLALLTIVVVYSYTEYALRRSHQPELRQLAMLTGASAMSDGHRMADILGCTGCHGANLQGQKFFSVPGIATVYASNLTRVLPKYTDDQLEAAIRQGIRHDGTTLVAMPSSGYAHLSDEHLASIVLYLRSFPAAGVDWPRASIGPLGRIAFIAGEFEPEAALAKRARHISPLATGKKHDAGRYLATVACAECHNFDLSGHQGGAPNLMIAGAYDPAAFAHLMRTGVAPGKRDLGVMSKVAKSRFVHFTDAEVEQLHAYLIERAARVPAKE